MHYRLVSLPIVLVFFCALSLSPKPSFSQAGIALTPSTVEAGAPELIRVNAPRATAVTGEWLGAQIAFFHPQPGGPWVALAGTDVEAAVGPSTLKITETRDGHSFEFSQTVPIAAAHYRTGSLSVAPRFVEPGPAELKEIHSEVALKARIFAASASEPLWHGSFRAPLPARPTDSFGTRRMFNGKLASVHKGADFKAATGTPVHASNAGIVVLARPLYYEGNCVVIDHGMGLYTLSMHFSRIAVHEGQHVNAGDLLGLSGATGRVTGPHLHWAVRWGNAYLDPVKLLRMNLAGLP